MLEFMVFKANVNINLFYSNLEKAILLSVQTKLEAERKRGNRKIRATLIIITYIL